MKKIRCFFSRYVSPCIAIYLYVSLCIVSAQSDISAQILKQIESNPSPRESVVQRYYALDDLEGRVQSASGDYKKSLPKISSIKSILRSKIDTAKSTQKKDTMFSLLNTYRSGVVTKESGLSALCQSRYQLVDDRSYAFNIPTPLVLATLDMESSCGRYRPNNGDGVFQLIAKDYGTGSLTTGQWIMMMYDFSALVAGKHARYHTANKLSKDACSTKNTSLTGQTAPICLSYTSMDIDSLIKHGALYNGLANATIKGDIQPGAPSYVYGRLNDAYSGSVKDGLLVKVMKVLKWESSRVSK